MADFDLAEAIVKFASCTETNWNNFNLPIPQNVVIVTLDTRKFKRGDGIHLYSDLPDGPSIEGIESGNESVVNSLTQLTAVNEDDIIVINNEIYSGSGTKLTTIMNRLGSIENKDAIQDANIVAIGNQFSMTNKGLVVGDNGKLAIVSDKKIAPGVLPETIVVETPQSPLHLISFDIYSDRACTNKVEELSYRSTYYAYIEASHDSVDIDNMTYGLTCDLNNNITITQVERGLYKIDIAYPATVTQIQFNISLSYNTDTVNIVNIFQLQEYDSILIGVYGGTGNESLMSVTTDSQDNIICVGSTSSEGAGNLDALIIKFDSSMNIVACKRYGGTGEDQFRYVVVDSNDNIFCCGYSFSQNSSYASILVVKFDSNLNLIHGKYFNSTVASSYSYSLAVDTLDNILLSGLTNTSTTSSGYIAKFDNNLTLLISKKYTGPSGSTYLRSVSIDKSNNNIICCGNTTTEAVGGHDTFVLKFDSSLNLITRKRYGGTGDEVFYDTIIDSNSNIICVGYTSSEGSGGNDALIVKFDSNLNIIARKYYGKNGTDSLWTVSVDDGDNIICCGGITESNSVQVLTILKFDSNLNIISQKAYSGAYNSYGYSLITDSNGNIICVGLINRDGTNTDALIMKFQSMLPNGMASGSIINELTFVDMSGATLSDSTLTLTTSTLTLANGDITFSNVSLTLADSNLTLTKDTLYI